MKKIFIAIALLLPLTAGAAGIEVWPSKLNIEAETGAVKKTEITVKNPASDIQLFEIYPDDLVYLFSITPQSFTLESGAKRTVTIEISNTKNESGIKKTDISVVGKPLVDSRFRANSGVKIPITISFLEKTDPSFPFWIIYLALALAILELFLHLLRKQKRNF